MRTKNLPVMEFITRAITYRHDPKVLESLICNDPQVLISLKDRLDGSNYIKIGDRFFIKLNSMQEIGFGIDETRKHSLKEICLLVFRLRNWANICRVPYKPNYINTQIIEASNQ